jgi:polysaccharide pyruvyl transferase WcaK-like protein
VTRRIVLTGGYGAGNLGDDLLATVAAATLRAEGAEVLVAAGDQGLPEAELTQHRSRLSRVLGRGDTLLLGGGGLFNDHWGLEYSTYFTSLGTIARARGSGAAAAGLGVEAPQTTAGRLLLAAAAQLLRPFGVRDPESLALLRRFRAGRPRLGIDLGWLAGPARPPITQGGEPVLAVTVAGETTAAARHRLDLLEQTLVRVTRERPGIEIRLIAMQRHSERLHDDAHLLAELAGRLRDHRTVQVSPATVAEACQAFGGTSVAVGYRLHGLLLGFLSGARVLAVSRSAKVAQTFGAAPGCTVVRESEADACAVATRLREMLAAAPVHLNDRAAFVDSRRAEARHHLLTMAGIR